MNSKVNIIVFKPVNQLWFPVIALSLAILSSKYVDSLHGTLSLENSFLLPMQQIAQILIWLAGGLLFNRLLMLIVWDGIVHRTLGRSPPRLIIQLTSVLVLLGIVSGIVRFVYDQPVTALLATSGAVGIVIAFALRNLILDTFSGLAIHLERPFKVGDWINCHTRMGEYIGRVEETNWRTTRLWTTSRNVIIIPNSYLTTTLLTNYTMSDTISRFELDFILDFAIPTDRAIRILSAALVSTIGEEGPLANPPPKVRANGIIEYGVQYRLRYTLDTTEVSPSKARNTITQAVVKHINKAGLTISYPRQDVFLARMPWRHKDWSYLKDQVRHLQSITLFSELSGEELEFIANHMTIHSLKKESIVVKQSDEGNSMFILAEGLLEVLITQPDGTQIKVADLAPGTFFGEKSLLTGELRSATIICVAESIICEITKTCIASLFEKNPQLVEKLGRAVIERDLQNEETLSRATKQEMNTHVSSALGMFIIKIKNIFGS